MNEQPHAQDGLEATLTKNRRDAAMVAPPVTNAILAQIDRELDCVARETEQLFEDYPTPRRQRELLASVPSIAETTAARILGEGAKHLRIPPRQIGRSVCRFIASPLQSGSIEYGSRLAKTGNAYLRRVLYFPAIRAIRHNPLIREFVDRLRARGKSKITVVAAAIGQATYTCLWCPQIGRFL